MIETRDYQQRIIQRALQAIEEGHRYILIESPTGSGKSIMGHLIAQELHRKYGWQSGWTAMRRHLLAQAQEMNQQMLGFEAIRYFSTFDANPPTGIDVLIDDESQHSASETATALYNKLKPKVVIGLSATPFRTDRMKLCFSRTIRDAGIRALIDAGWLAKYHQYSFDAEWTPQNVAQVYLRDPQRWGKSVMFFYTLRQCFECAQILSRSGIPCDVVYGESDQEAQLERFRRGELAVLINVIVLTEGMDCPDLRTVFVRPGSKGPTMQMTGRALRKHPDKPFAQVVQNHRTRWPFTKIASAEQKFSWEKDHWHSRVAVTEKITHATSNTLLAIASLTITLPPKLQRRKTKAALPSQRADAA